MNGAATQFLYDGLDIAQQLEAQRTTSYLRTLAIDETIGLTNPDGPFFLTADALASIVRITGASGNAVADYTYDTFGAVSATIPAIPNPFQFTGREHDGLAGLYYYRARYYSPVLHRFLSEDPLGLNGGTRDASVYAANNPVNLRDPEGLIVGTLLVRLSNFLLKSGLTAEEIAVNGKIADAALGLAFGLTGRSGQSALRQVNVPGSNVLTVGDLLAGGTLVGGLQTLSFGRNIAALSGIGASATSVGAVGFGLLGGLALAGGFEVGSALNDLVLNNRRLFPGGNPLENFIFDNFVVPRIDFASTTGKGTFGRGR